MTIIDLSIAENRLTQTLIGCFIRVHSAIGPGLLEGVYEECLCHVLKMEEISFERQKQVPIFFEDIKLESPLRLDLLIEDKIILELKSVETVLPVHEAQIISYLRLAQKQIGFIVNFNVPLMKSGIKRFTNNFNPSSALSAPPR
ncbi:MAG TPA: GxxExxY protein [Alphaproteobacteria bacterium]|nr:GxxExxY protein [Alphaproteobacteria bacterium]